MRLHTEGNYPILLIVLLEFARQVALMAVQGEEPIPTNRTSLCICVKVLEPVYPKDVRSPPIITNYKNLVQWELFLVPGGQVVCTSKDEEGWYCPASSVNPLDQSYPLTVTWLYSLWPASPLRPCYDQLRRDLAYHKARFVKVVDVLIYNTVPSPLLLYPLKPPANYNRILTESPLPVVRAIEMCCETVCTLNKVVRLVDSYRLASALREQSISYLTYSSQVGSKSTFIQVQNTLNNHLLFYLGKLLCIRLAVAS